MDVCIHSYGFNLRFVKAQSTNHIKVFYAYTYGTAAWFTLQAAPLIVSPTIILTLLNPEVREPSGQSLSL